MPYLYSVMLAMVFVVGSAFLTLTFYALARRLLGHKLEADSADIASSIIFRISALHALILALVFAQELQDYNSVRKTLNTEAAAVGDVFFDLGRLDPDTTLKLRKSLASYTHSVVHDEWARLGQGDGLSPTAWRHWEATYQGILDLDVTGARNEALVSNLLSTVRPIAGYRRARDNAAVYGLNPLFWIVAVVGLMLVAIPYMTFPPVFMNLTMLSIFGGYTGLVMFAIAAVSNPYKAPAKLEPIGMRQLLKSEMSNFYTGK